MFMQRWMQYVVDPCRVLSIIHLVALNILLTFLLSRSPSFIRVESADVVSTIALFFLLVLTILVAMLI